MVKCSYVNYNTGLTDTLDLLDLPEPPDAIIATHGLLVGSAIRAIESRGLRIPEDVSLIGYMSDWVSDVMSPRMSFIKQNQREMGAKAFRLLYDQLNGDTCVQHVIVKARLEIRNSTREIIEE